MQRLLLGFTALTLTGALAGIALSWPDGGSNPETASPTLAEFQNGVRFSRQTVAAKEPAPIAAYQPERVQLVAVRVVAESMPAMEAIDRRPEPARQSPTQPFRIAFNGPPQEMLSVGENVPEADLPALPKPHATQGAPLPDEHPSEAERPAGTEPTPVVTLAAAGMPAQVRSDVATTPATIADTPRPDDRPADSPGAAAEAQKPQAQATNSPGASVSRQTLMAGRHAEHVSIHYHSDTRSRMDAQRISGRLGSAGLAAVEMHTTAHVVPASLVRYFSPRDAADAAALAKALGSKANDWRVDDCTAYQHKPERGTIEIWPATVHASR